MVVIGYGHRNCRSGKIANTNDLIIGKTIPWIAPIDKIPFSPKVIRSGTNLNAWFVGIGSTQVTNTLIQVIKVTRRSQIGEAGKTGSRVVLRAAADTIRREIFVTFDNAGKGWENDVPQIGFAHSDDLRTTTGKHRLGTVGLVAIPHRKVARNDPVATISFFLQLVKDGYEHGTAIVAYLRVPG